MSTEIIMTPEETVVEHKYEMRAYTGSINMPVSDSIQRRGIPPGSRIEFSVVLTMPEDELAPSRHEVFRTVVAAWDKALHNPLAADLQRSMIENIFKAYEYAESVTVFLPLIRYAPLTISRQVPNRRFVAYSGDVVSGSVYGRMIGR